MPASLRVTRRRLLVALGALVLAAVVAAAVVALRPDGGPAAGATTSASPTASPGADGGSDAEAGPGNGPSDGGPSADDGTDAEPKPSADEGAAPEPRETLDPAPFDAVATPKPGVTVTVASVETVTGEASVPGEVGGPALRFTVDLANGTDEVLDLRTVVVNAYYGPDRTPTTPLLKPGARAFAADVDAGGSARGVFVFGVPPEFRDEVELEIDPGVGAAVVIFTGA